MVLFFIAVIESRLKGASKEEFTTNGCLVNKISNVNSWLVKAEQTAYYITYGVGYTSVSKPVKLDTNNSDKVIETVTDVSGLSRSATTWQNNDDVKVTYNDLTGHFEVTRSYTSNTDT